MKTTKKPPARPKHIPQRTCVSCRQVEGKRGLIRVVRTADGIAIDPTGKQAGRGAYIHNKRACWEQVLIGNRLNQALRTTITPADREMLTAFVASLAEDEDVVE